MSLELINNSVDFAREISREVELRPGLPSEEDLQAAVNVMNQYLWGVKGDIRATFITDEAYLDLPDSPETIELFSHNSLRASRLPEAIVRGKIDSFKWLGTTGMNAFGLHMNGVDVLAPVRLKTTNAFLPIDAIGNQFAA